MRRNLYLLASVGSLFQTVASNLCPCGFYDPSTEQIFTESIIVYFNETQSIPDDVFRVQSYTRKVGRGFNSVFRQGAAVDNVLISDAYGDQRALDLFVDPGTKDHVVYGGGIESLRQDLLHGTFRASVRGPGAWTGGSAMSMMLQYNDSSSMEIDLLNTNNPNNARITTLINGEYPSQDLSTNYTVLQSGSEGLPPVDPWDFINIRMDWTRRFINFTLAENLTRSVSRKNNDLPTEPLPLTLKHWSNGDTQWMQGPPLHRTVASVAWIRAFFNSSVTTTAERREFDKQCSTAAACNVEDMTLRISTNYTSASLKAWKEPPRNEEWQQTSGIVAGCSSFFGIIAVLNVLLRKKPWELLSKRGRSSKGVADSQHSADSDEPRDSMNSDVTFVGTPTRQEWDNNNNPLVLVPEVCTTTSRETRPRAFLSRTASSRETRPQAFLSRTASSRSNAGKPADDQASQTGSLDPSLSSGQTLVSKASSLEEKDSPTRLHDTKQATLPQQHETKQDTLPQPGLLTAGASLAPPGAAVPPVRIDYLAGLVAISCIGVTFIHFTLTFIPYAGGLEASRHYKSELYARWSVTAIFLNPIWIGPFFTTSARFLAQNYLRNGNLADVAKKTLLRAPRMMAPVLTVAALEYFFIELGLTSNLELLPSITWSTWPWVTNYENFGYFLNDALELAYLTPNAAPKIVSHYCTGVLWTIPVQLQFSFLTLIGAVMVRDIKTTWKRAAFYTWCIVVNWYAISWGSCFWLGLMIADLNVTYDYVNFLRARPRYFYPFCIGLWILMFQGPLWTWLQDRGFYPIMSAERGIHPDPKTGLPQEAVAAMYPEYFEPRLNTIFFAAAVQMLTELSHSIQHFLSLHIWTSVFPHTYTVYLIHGIVFWTFGAWLCVTLFELQTLPYWAICLILVLCCYTLIGLLAIIMTPAIEGVASKLGAWVWSWGHEEKVPRRRTLAPYGKDLLVRSKRSGGDVEEGGQVPEVEGKSK